MIHEGRCGSTVLGSLINQHPEIVHFSEILTPGCWVSPEFMGSELELKRNAIQIKLPDLNGFIRAISETSNALEKPNRRYTGIEIKLNQLSPLHLDCDPATLVSRLSAEWKDARFMFLTRRNILRRHISTLRCLYKNVSHTDKIASVNFEKVRLEADMTLRDWSYNFAKVHDSIPELLEVSEARRLAVRDFALANGHLYLEYEDFERNPSAGARRIFDFLGLEAIEAESWLLKTGDLPLSELIENYDEVRESLAGTRWERMLD